MLICCQTDGTLHKNNNVNTEMQWCRARDFDVSQIPVTTGGFKVHLVQKPNHYVLVG